MRLSLRNVLSHLTVLNILLVVLVWQLFQHFHHSLNYDLSISLSELKPKSQAVIVGNLDNTENQKQEQTIVEYSNIINKNLFHPDRHVPPEKKVVQELPKPEIILYGTMITEETKIAFIEDIKSKVTTPGRGKRQRPIKTGEVISGFTVKDITEDKIVLQRGEESFAVSVLDPGKKKDRQSMQPTPTAKQHPIPPQQASTVKPALTPAPPPQRPQNTPSPPQPPQEGFNPLLDAIRRSGG